MIQVLTVPSPFRSPGLGESRKVWRVDSDQKKDAALSSSQGDKAEIRLSERLDFAKGRLAASMLADKVDDLIHASPWREYFTHAEFF
jgi:hypothetical protein